MASASRGMVWVFAVLSLLSFDSFHSIANAQTQARPASTNATSASASASASASTQSVQEALKTLVSNSQLKLGDLAAWQKKIFVEEAIPQYQRFVRDYRVNGSNVQAEVDVDILKKYLAFHINPHDNKKQETRIGVFVRGEPSCEKCTAASAKLRQLALARLERRGFTPVFVSADDLNTVTGKTIEEKVLAVTQRKAWIGAAVVQSYIAPKDELDSAHADENEYIVKATLLVPTTRTRQENQLRVLESESLENATARILTDAFTDIGASALASSIAGGSEDSGEEISLVINGVRDFHQFAQLKMMLQSKLNGIALVEERKLSRGRMVFGVKTAKAAPEIRAQLAQMTLDQARWTLKPETSAVALADAGASQEKVIEAEIQ